MNTPLEAINLGNLKSISLIALDNLLSIPQPVAGEISFNDLTFAENKAFQEIYFTPETGSFIENDDRTNAGTVWKKEINLQIPKIRSEIIAGLQNFENRKNAALVTDMNGTSFLVFPLRILRKKQIPGQITSINAIMLNLTGVSISESPVITDLP
jgi:hypothetical protein